MLKDGMSVVVTSFGVFPGPRRKFTDIIKELSGNGSKVSLGTFWTPVVRWMTFKLIVEQI